MEIKQAKEIICEYLDIREICHDLLKKAKIQKEKSKVYYVNCEILETICSIIENYRAMEYKSARARLKERCKEINDLIV